MGKLSKTSLFFLKKNDTTNFTTKTSSAPCAPPPTGSPGPTLTICSTTTILVSTTKHPPRSSTINPDGDLNCPGSHTKRCYLKWNLCPSGTSKEFASLMNTSVSGKFILNALAASSFSSTAQLVLTPVESGTVSPLHCTSD